MNFTQLGRAVQFTIIILPIIITWDGWIHSWYRCEERNDDVGGDEFSRHRDATAVDTGFYDVIKRNNAYDECYQCGLHGYKYDWVDRKTGKPVFGFHMQLEAPRGS